MKTMKIKFISNNEAQVTKAFAKKAVIFGTEEYNLWKEYRKDFPEAKMVTKSIKKNPNKKTNRNLTYENMARYIRTLDNAEQRMEEFRITIEASKIQTSPYRAVLAWFEMNFAGYDNYKNYFAELAEKAAAENDMFTLVA